MAGSWDKGTSVLVRRLASARYPLTVAGLIAIAYGVANDALVPTAFLYGLVIVAAAFGPQRSRAERIRQRLDRFRARQRSKRPGVAATLDALPNPVLEIDRNGTITRANRAASEAFGAGLRGLVLHVRFRSPALRALIGEAERRPVGAWSTQPEAFGTDRRYSVHAATARARGDDAPRKKQRTILFFREETRTLREARSRTDFVANASHELRTPLTALIGFIETLRGPARDDAAARDRFLEIMDVQARRMARLVDDLLSLSRAERESAKRPRDTIDLTAIIQQVGETARGRFLEDGIALDVELPDGSVFVRGDADGLMQVVTNLVENARRYGGGGGRVEVRLHVKDGMAETSVRDWGQGIDPVHLPRLTERFYRADAERSRQTGGTGLGLAIVKHILARHDSRLRIESRQGEGATFQFNLGTAEEINKNK